MLLRSLLLILYSAGYLFLFSQNTDTTALARASKLADENRCEEAITIYRGLIAQTDSSQDPNTYLSNWLRVASCEIDLFHFDYAISIFERVLDWGKTHPVPHDTVIAWAYGDLGYTYGKLSQYPEQLEQYKTSLQYKLKFYGEEHKEIGSAYNNLGTAYGRVRDYENQLECYHKALSIRKTSLGPDHAKVGATLNNIGYCYGRMGDYEKELDYYQQGLAIRLADLGEAHPRVARSYNNIGYALQSMGRYEEASSYFRKALPILQNHYGTEHPAVARVYQNLGPCLGSVSDYGLAISYSEKALDIYSKYYGESSEHVAIVLNNLSIEYMRIGQLTKAIELQERSLRYREAIFGKNSLEVAKALANLAVNYSEAGDNEKAIALNLRALEIRKELLPEGHPDLTLSHSNLGAEFAINNQLDRAKSELKKALNSKTGSQSSIRDLYSTLLYLGLAYSRDNQPDSAIYYVQEALISEAPSMKGKGIFEPLPDSLIGKNGILLNILERKAWTLSQNKDALESLKAANSCFEQAAESLDRLRIQTGNQTKQLLGAEWSVVFSGWINNNERLFQLTGDPQYLNKAWEAVSRSKAFLLREQLQKHRRSSFAGVPDSLVQKERNLQAGIATLRAKLLQYASPQSRLDSILVQQWKNSLLDLEMKQGNLISLFRKKHPQYYQEKFSLKAPDLKALQRKLRKENVKLLQFFREENKLYIFYVDQRDIQLKSLVLEEDFDKKLTSYIRFFQQANWGDQERTHFIDLSHGLYNKLMAPFEEKLRENDRLVIIPDQQLGYIPFETLLVSKNQGAGFAQLDYLLRHYSVGYAYHSDFMLDVPRGDFSALVMAPAFGPGTDSLRAMMPRLRYGEEEQKAILNHFKSTTAEATEGTFKQLAGKFSLLHLTTHSLIDSIHPESSCLLFGADNDSLNDGKLHNYELYNMRLDAQMAVLSACNTGIGKLQQGEGVMSLAHAFTYSGCPNVIMSLWQVNDHSTAELMRLFYEGLAAEKPKDIALREAKLAYLQSADPLKASPYFWAGFVSIGEQAPLRRHSWALALWIALGLVMLGGGIIVYRKVQA